MAIDTLGANALASNSVTTVKIADDAVTSAKIPAGAVVVGDIADGSISTAKLADDAVTSAKLDTNISIGGTLGVTGAITASAGVAVGGTGDVNTLDDYEEGTFEIKLRNITAGVDTNAKTCRYVKIGKMVMIQWPDGGTGAAGQYWTDNTASGSAAAAGVKFGVSTSTGYNSLPFLPKGTAQENFDYALDLASQLDFDNAEKAFKEFLKKHKESDKVADAQYWLGRVYFAQKKFEEAAIALAEFNSVFPNDPRFQETTLLIAESAVNFAPKDQLCDILKQSLEFMVNPSDKFVKRINILKNKKQCNTG